MNQVTSHRARLAGIGAALAVLIGGVVVTAPAATTDPTATLDALLNEHSTSIAGHSSAIADLDSRVDALEAAPTPTPSTTTVTETVTPTSPPTGTPTSAPAPASNDIILADVPGETYNDKLTEALRLQALDSARVIRVTHRDHGASFTRTNTYCGKPPRIVGPVLGMSNPEQGVKPPVLLKVDVGTGANSWFVGTCQTFNPLLAGVVLQSGNSNSQLWHHSYNAGAGTVYAGTFIDIVLYGFRHGWGMPGDAFTNTLTYWGGVIQFPGIKSTALSLRGADSWYEAVTNLDGLFGNGTYLVRFENWTKSHMENMYLTARDGTRAVYNESPDTSGQGGTYLQDSIVEGHNAGDPAHGALIVNKSGHLFVSNTTINFGVSGESAMDATIDTALVRVLGGKVVVSNTSTSKQTATAANPPFAHVSAGDLFLSGAPLPAANTGGTPPVVRQTGTGRVNPAAFSLSTN